MLKLCGHGYLSRMKIVSNKYPRYFKIEPLIDKSSKLSHYDILAWLLTLPPILTDSTIHDVFNSAKIQDFKNIIRRIGNITYTAMKYALNSNIDWEQKIDCIIDIYNTSNIIPYIINHIKEERLNYIYEKYNHIIIDNYSDYISKIFKCNRLLQLGKKYNCDIKSQISSTNYIDNDKIIEHYDNNSVILQEIIEDFINKKQYFYALNLYVDSSKKNIDVSGSMFLSLLEKENFCAENPQIIFSIINEFDLNNITIIEKVIPIIKKLKRKHDSDCCICYEYSNTSFNCGHNTCLTCVGKMNNTKCPICREVIHLIYSL
jgi:hypothetical protein